MKVGVLGATGNLSLQNRLWDYLKSGRVHQTLLLAGPDTRVKAETAKGMAKSLLCAQKKNSPFCGQCSSCLRIEKEIHPDVFFLHDTEEDTLKVDTIREISHQMAIAPLEARAKVCIIEECHRMNTASANAFLKTLEEPGTERYFLLLTTQPGSLLPTILSRCLTFTFKPEEDFALSPAEQDQFAQILKEFQASRNAANLVAALEEKSELLKFVKYLQSELRNAAINSSVGGMRQGPFRDWDSYRCTQKFDELVGLEGRLRSNANYGLMLETVMRQNF